LFGPNLSAPGKQPVRADKLIDSRLIGFRRNPDRAWGDQAMTHTRHACDIGLQQCVEIRHIADADEVRLSDMEKMEEMPAKPMPKPAAMRSSIGSSWEDI
jgi:hypothetical protein